MARDLQNPLTVLHLPPLPLCRLKGTLQLGPDPIFLTVECSIG